MNNKWNHHHRLSSSLLVQAKALRKPASSPAFLYRYHMGNVMGLYITMLTVQPHARVTSHRPRATTRCRWPGPVQSRPLRTRASARGRRESRCRLAVGALVDPVRTFSIIDSSKTFLSVSRWSLLKPAYQSHHSGLASSSKAA